MNQKSKQTKLEQKESYWRGSFAAMASPCELLMEVDNKAAAEKLLNAVSTEAKRIEQKFSRYLNGNIIHKINNATGKPVVVDDETARLFDFANELHQMSGGMFDVTSGVLRKVWKFDGSDNVPTSEDIKNVLRNVGWDKVLWENKTITMPSGMEIDFGGIGKEYAVDSCVQVARKISNDSVLINFGGDLATSCKRKNDSFWSVGRLISDNDSDVALFQLYQGAIATSGDAHRYLLKDGVRYSHVLNPKTGWPIENAPHTVSVAATSCVEAGMMSTIASLHGSQASDFLKKQDVSYWLGET